MGPFGAPLPPPRARYKGPAAALASRGCVSWVLVLTC